MNVVNKMTFFSSLFFWPNLCLGADDSCVTDVRTLLSPQNFVYIAGDYIDEGKITYSPSAQKDMTEHFVEKSDIEYTLHYPAEVKAHSDDSNKYHVIGSPDKNKKQLRIETFFEAGGERGLVIARVAFLQKRVSLSEKKLKYTVNAGRTMRERKITQRNVEYILKHSIEMDAQTLRGNASGITYITGTYSGNRLLKLGIDLQEEYIVVTSVERVFRDQLLPLLKEDFAHFMDDYFRAQKNITYTRRVENFMHRLGIGEDYIKYALRNPIKITKRPMLEGYCVTTQFERGGGELRLLIAFIDEQIHLIIIDMPITIRRAYEK